MTQENNRKPNPRRPGQETRVLRGTPPKCLIVALVGPSGVGKTTLAAALTEDDRLLPAVSTTSRAPREGEIDGVHYHFETDVSKMRGDMALGEYIEYVQYHGNLYGFHNRTIYDIFDQGKHAVAVIERHGLEQFRKYRFPTTRSFPRGKYAGVEIFAVLLLPPDKQALQDRLLKDRTQEEALKRIQTAQEEMYSTWGAFDAIIVNDNLEHARAQLVSLVNHKLEQMVYVAALPEEDA